MNVLDHFCIKEIKRRGGTARKSHGNVFQAGWPDIIGCYKGRFLGIETKLGEDRVRPAQKIFMHEFEKAGGVCAVVGIQEEIIEILDNIDRACAVCAK